MFSIKDREDGDDPKTLAERGSPPKVDRGTGSTDAAITGELYMLAQTTPIAPSSQAARARLAHLVGCIFFLIFGSLSLGTLPAGGQGPSEDVPSEVESLETVTEESNLAVAQGPTTTTASATFSEQVTVSATRSQRSLVKTPGQVDVVEVSEIQSLGYTSISDLVRWLPGVYVDGDPTRLGSSGFNIRGIGGNRVLTQIDGVPTAEQFDFGPFAVSQYNLDIETLERAEVVRSAGSALYGSDALGGVVSLVTRSPRSYLGTLPQFLSLRLGFDGRSEEVSETVVYARGNDRWQGSVVYGHRDGAEGDNQGRITSNDASRTAPNPIDRRQDNVLLKMGRSGDSGSQLEMAFEGFDGDSRTEVLSAQTVGAATGVADADTDDGQQRLRLSLEHSLVLQHPLADALLWRAYGQRADTEQQTFELRRNVAGLSERSGSLTFEQQTVGLEVEARRAWGRAKGQNLTYGLSLRRDVFDGLRDRRESFVDSGEPVPTTLILPSKYFPESEVTEIGAFVQGELAWAGGRLQVIPGLRFDSYELRPDAMDEVFLRSNPGQPLVDNEDHAVSPRLGVVWALGDQISLFGQYAKGFRAPPMSAVNNGFTNPAGGYRTLPNADLEPETSDNFELGVRGAFDRGGISVTVFENHYEDFIETVFLGFNPSNFLVEFQPQNLTEVEISGLEVAADLRLGRSWRLRGAYSRSAGDDLSAEQPLDSISPPRLVTGARYARPGGRWGVELNVTVVEAKEADDLPSDSNQFQAPAYDVVDLAAWWHLNDRWMLQLSGWNLGDETYWPWAYARGQSNDSATLERFTSAGRSVGLQARARF